MNHSFLKNVYLVFDVSEGTALMEKEHQENIKYLMFYCRKKITIIADLATRTNPKHTIKEGAFIA